VGDEPEIWAFRLIKNLKLETTANPLTDRRRRQIDARLDSLVWRTYFPTGSGGFFPLKNPQSDQTKKEIWAQMAEYINERYDFH
jgi:hypothetical protein